MRLVLITTGDKGYRKTELGLYTLPHCPGRGASMCTGVPVEFSQRISDLDRIHQEPRTWQLFQPQWIFLKFTEFFVNPVNLTKVDFSNEKTTLGTLECIPVTHVALQWLKWHPGDSILDPGDSILYPGALGCTLADFSTPTRAVRKCVVIK